MYCPNCKEELESLLIENQKILHCSNCGGSFFEENGINRITILEAQKLAFKKKGNILHDAQKVCPKDRTFLHIVQSEAIPSNVELYECEKCKGIYASPDHLLIFKNAQKAKIEYFKWWNIPLPSTRAVLVASLAVFLSVSAVSTALNLRNGLTIPSQAEDVVNSLHTSKSGRYVFLTFKTEHPYKTSISFYDTKLNNTYQYAVSNTYNTIHYLTTTDLDLDHVIQYQITLSDPYNHTIKTKLQPLTLK